MKRPCLLLTVLILIFPQLPAAQEVQNSSSPPPSSAQNETWLRISEVEKEKDEIFRKYQKDKTDLENKYQEASWQIQETGGEDMLEKQANLDREYNRNKDVLLKAYRQENWRLEKKANALKGRKTLKTSEIQLKRKLKHTSGQDSVLGTKKQNSLGKKNFIKNKEDPSERRLRERGLIR